MLALRTTQAYTLAAVILFTGLALPAHAQIFPNFQNTLTLSTSPRTPGPQEEVLVSVQSFSINIDTAAIAWFINGSLIQEGVGNKSFRFTTGRIGSTSKIDIVAETPDGTVHNETLTIRPTEVSIIWQAQSETHPFYLGKTLPAIGGELRIQALPEFVNDSGRKLGKGELVYTWRVDGKLDQARSGNGRDSITVTQRKPVRSLPIEITVESPANLLSKTERFFVPIADPLVFVYENSPLLGPLFNKAAGNSYSFTEQETDLTAYPFYMSLSNRNDKHIVYSWEVGGEKVTLGDDRSSITLNNAGGSSGAVNISVEVNNLRDIFQRASSAFSVAFGTRESGFGF